jgi:hypothetical protein
MRSFLATVTAVALVACSGGNDDPAGASQLWARLRGSGDYHTFARAPGYPGTTPSTSPHGDQVEIWINGTVQGALDAKVPVNGWPDGSLIVEDGSKSGTLTFVLAMEKRGTAWYWAEYRSDGSVEYSGAPSACTGCHASGGDFVRSLSLPR